MLHSLKIIVITAGDEIKHDCLCTAGVLTVVKP